MKFEIAPQDNVDRLKPYIEKLLITLGHPDALVTDASTFLDFMCMVEYPTRDSAQQELDNLFDGTGFSFGVGTTLALAAEAMKQHAAFERWAQLEKDIGQEK